MEEQDPQAIRREIEDTRSRMGDTVEALAYKTDVKARTRDAVSDRVDTIRGKIGDAMSSARSAVGTATASAQQSAASATDAMRQSVIVRNPLGIAIGSLAVGFLIGLALPVTEIERERVGPIGEQMTDSAKSAAASALEHGKAAVTQAIGDALTGAGGAGTTSAENA